MRFRLSFFSFFSRRFLSPKLCEGGSNILLALLCVSGLISYSSIASAIEVSGHLTEDTIWSPDNNPYLVIDDVYVDDDVTLTILPGTIVKFNAALLASEQDMDNFVYYNGANIAKMIQVDGRLTANGTEEEPIIFTRIQDSLYYHWGIIYLTEFADLCSFKYCHFEYSAYLLIVLGIIPCGAVSIYNEEAIIEYCDFVDNFTGVFIQFYPQKVIIKNSTFFNIDNISPTYPDMHVYGGIDIAAGVIGESDIILIAGNQFNESNISYFYLDIFNAPAYVINNQFSVGGFRAAMDSETASYIYKNNFINCTEGLRGGYPNDSLYIKKNNFIGGNDGININHAYVEISDNYFEGCDLDTEYAIGKIYNNISDVGEVWTPGEIEVFNNICFNNINGYGLKVGYNPYCVNNISINNRYDIWSATNLYENCIFILNEELTQYSVNSDPIFRNCIIDFPLEPPLIDGGGNIIIDSLQSHLLFEDIENGDFHLIEGSLAIDAGFDTLGYYYPFDIENSLRVWDGDGDGNAIIDIGAYEYGAPQLGKITGYITETDTGELVDYVLIKADNEPGNFTFADSSGYFEIQLPEGTYDLYAERVFYEDNIIYTVTVVNEQNTEIAFNMTSTLPQVGINDDELNINNSKLKISNYPNPFNPATTISFSIPNNNNVELSIFNIKGQKVTTLINEQMQKGKHTSIWSGLDSNNKPVSSGIYLYKVKAGNQESVKRMLLLK